MLNIFKHKTVEAPKIEKPEQEAPAENIETATVETDPNEARVEILIESLTDYLIECKKNGIELTPEMAETEIEKLEAGIEEIYGEKIDNAEVRKTYEAIAANIEDVMSQKAENKGTILSKLRENIFKSNFAKGLVLSTILFFKFNSGHAANTDKVKDKVLQKTDAQKQVKHEGGDKNTYDATEDFKHQTTIKLEADSHFDNDKADLKNPAELASEFDKFLSSINDRNIDKFINEAWTVAGSSDQNKRPGGNEQLTNNRINSFVKLLSTTLANHDFSKQLSPDNASKILNKKINTTYPTGGAERGVTYITDLVNAETGHQFTDAEVAKIKVENPSEYQKLLAKCRYTNFEAEVVLEPEMLKLGNFDECSIYFDSSGSMETPKNAIINDLQVLSKGENSQKPIEIIFFSEGLDKTEKTHNSLEALKVLRQSDVKGSDQERVFTSLTKGLERTAKDDVSKIKNGEKLPNRVAYLITNEGLQDVNQIFKAADLASKTNTSVELLMAYNNGTKEIKINLNDLKDKVEKNIKETLKTEKANLEQSKINQEKNLENLALKVVAKVSPKTLKEVLGQDKLGTDAETVKALMTGHLKFPKFEKALDSRIEDSILKPLFSAKADLEKMDGKIDKAEKMSVEQYMAANKLQIDTFTDAEGHKVVLPITGISGTSTTAQSHEVVKPIMLDIK